MNRLNLGCGKDIRQDWINLDKVNLPGVDIVHDLGILPLPFETEHFDHILAKDILEHIEYVPLLEELHRILRVNGTLSIQVPHFTSVDNFIDPTHIKRFSIRTFEFFTPERSSERSYYFNFSFRKMENLRIGFFRGPLLWDYALEMLANASYRTQKYYELTFLSRLFPAQNITLTLVK